MWAFVGLFKGGGVFILICKLIKKEENAMRLESSFSKKEQYPRHLTLPVKSKQVKPLPIHLGSDESEWA